MGWSSAAYYGTQDLLWVWSQTGTGTNILTAIDTDTDVVVGTYSFTLPGTQGTAGGASVCDLNGEWVLLLNYQNLAIWLLLHCCCSG
jgi:hypothetical protein